jgi:hypothetical protein
MLRNQTVRRNGPIVQPIAAVRLEATDKSAFDTTIKETVKWLSKRSGTGLPNTAFQGLPFRTEQSTGANLVEIIRPLAKSEGLWAARLEYPDRTLAQRSWITEVVIARQIVTTQIDVKLICVTKGQYEAISPSVPGVLLQLATNLSLEIDGAQVTERPLQVSRPNSETLFSLLENPARVRPVVVVSVGQNSSGDVRAHKILKRVVGAAHVVEIDAEGSWALTAKYGKPLSVFNQAVRLYAPGFNANSNRFSHRLYIADSSSDADSLADEVATDILPTSFSTSIGNAEVPSFATLKALGAANITPPVSAKPLLDTERIASLEQENARLRKLNADLVERARDEDAARDQLIEEASERAADALNERNDAFAEAVSLRGRLKVMQAIRTTASVAESPPLNSMSDIEIFIENHFDADIVVQQRAIRETKSSIFEDPVFFGKCLLFLRDCFVPTKQGALSADIYERKMSELQLEESFCFSQKGQIKGFPQYRTSYNGTQYWMDRHFKYRSGKDHRTMFRIYYYWHEDEQVMIIGHMPTHLDNNLTD